jgi:hypothetical protein
MFLKASALSSFAAAMISGIFSSEHFSDMQSLALTDPYAILLQSLSIS